MDPDPLGFELFCRIRPLVCPENLLTFYKIKKKTFKIGIQRTVLVLTFDELFDYIFTGPRIITIFLKYIFEST